jgi:transposase InsO family protein
MLNSSNICSFGNLSQNKATDIMRTQAEVKLNPLRCYLSPEAKKRLKWMYLVKYECDSNITQAAKRIGISRVWLSQIHGRWKNSREDPRSLEPESRAPHDTTDRQRVSRKTEDKIVELRKKYRPWGKDKLSVILKRDCQLQAGASTVNRYLHKHHLIDPKLSEKNKLAWRRKKEQTEMKFKTRPPKIIKDYKPGALMEKDMKLVLKMGIFTNSDKHRAKENFWYQHTLIDSFTRIRAVGLAEDANSRTAVAVQEQAAKRLPFAIAAINNDNGGENEKDFSAYLEQERVAQFFSRAGTPTDNPRVERSHLTDELEFYAQGNARKNFNDQTKAISEWEHTYNFVRPHQALGYLTPMEFYERWQSNPREAYRIKNKYQAYLKKQSRRLAKSRQMKNKEQIENLMKFIDKKLSKSNS